MTITSLTIDELAMLLQKAGGRHVDADAVRRDLEAGAPQNGDGSINLFHYAAWMIKEMGRGNA